ncbi:MAG: ASCH domain-containing protein [Casimicrobium sp.]
MKCLTIRQPWAWLIVNGYKPVENRSWPTSLRGPVLIQASKTMELKNYAREAAYVQTNISQQHGLAIAASASEILDSFGRIIGKVTLTACVQSHESPYFVGPYGHVMTTPRRCEPFPLKGKLGYFDVPDDIVSQLKWIST